MFSKRITNNTKQNNNQGFTLVEVMIGMAIFLVGFLAVGSMQITSINGNTNARKATEAATRAADQLETMISLPFDNIVSGGPVTQGAYTTSWTVLDNNPLPDTKTITVTVDYLSRGPKSFELTYIKTENL